MNDIAKNIKKLRQKKKLTQEELAEKIYVTRQAVSNWETGKNQPDVDTLKSLAEVLEVDVKDVLYGPTPDESRRRKAITVAALWALTGLAFLIFALLFDKAQFIKSRYYDLRLMAALVFGVRPLAYLLLGAAAAALICAWRSLHPATLRAQRWILAAGAAVLLAYALGFLFLRHVPQMSYYWTLWAGYGYWTFLLPGALLFCGSARKAG